MTDRTFATTVPLLIINDLGVRKLPPPAAKDILEIVIRRYERASTLLTSNRPVDDWGSRISSGYSKSHDLPLEAAKSLATPQDHNELRNHLHLVF